MAVNNKAIRKKLPGMIKPHGFALTAASCLCLIAPLLVLVPIQGLLTDSALLARACSFAFSVLAYPIIIAGFSYIYLQKWQGQGARLGDILHFVRSGPRFYNALLVGLAYNIIIQVPTLAGNLLSGLAGEGSGFFLVKLAAAALTILGLWLTLRLALVPYILCVDPEQKPLALISDAFRRMGGEVGRFIRLLLSVAWWRFLLAAAVMALPPLILDRPDMWGAGTQSMLLFSLGSMLIFALLSPKIFLAAAGFAHGLIPTRRELGRAKRNKD